MDTILVVNAGSSSVKFQVFAVAGERRLDRLIKGQMDGVGTQPTLRAESADREPLIKRSYTAAEVADIPAALDVVAIWLRTARKLAPVAVGHRVVHGGPKYGQPVVMTREVLGELEQYVSLAPLHQPNNLAPIRRIFDRFPDLPQVACFDTAFHRGHSAAADHYALPESFYVEGIRRYGFHGLSYEYVSKRLRELAPDVAGGRVIIAHLGSGASMCALSGGRSIDSTMGFTALDGLAMGTRPGQIDPGVVLHLLVEKGMTPAALRDFLYRECGLRGISGISGDLRDLMASAAPSAAFAIDYFVYRVALNAGMLVAALGGLDAFVFTAGIGENSAEVRARIAEKLGWVGLALDPAANSAGNTLISRKESRVRAYVVPTDEELMIGRHTLGLTSDRNRPYPRAA